MSGEARMARVCDCGHVAQVHHGADHGPASHQGCQHGSRLLGYCGCELTSGQVADLQDPALFEDGGWETLATAHAELGRIPVTIECDEGPIVAPAAPHPTLPIATRKGH